MSQIICLTYCHQNYDSGQELSYDFGRRDWDQILIHYENKTVCLRKN